MTATLTVRDETMAGGVSEPWSLEFPGETITVRDLIRERVYQEVQDHNVRRKGVGPYRGLVRPEARGTGAEAEARPIDWHQQFGRAVEAFRANYILILIDDRQAESLDESFTIQAGTAVTFLRLTLLVGG